MPFFTSSAKSPALKESQEETDNSHKLEKTSSVSSEDYDSDAPPPYENAAASSSAAPHNTFVATSQLQVQAEGYDINRALSGTTLENIPVFRVDSGETEYTSFRLKRSSNSCALVQGSHPAGSARIATVYRWGPGRPPRIRIFPARASVSVEDAIESDSVDCEMLEVRSRSMISRAQKLETSFGTFEWRYGSRKERKENYDAASLLILERTDLVACAGGMAGKRGIRVAQLVRNDEFRTPGTGRYMGGNGGRLMMDLSMWTDDKRASAKDVEAFVVASCICMLKREADRFRNNQIAAVT